MIPEYHPPNMSDLAEAWTFELKRRRRRPARTPLDPAEVERREFRRRFIEGPRQRQFDNYVATGEWRVIS